jgi:hypothetical protein
MVCPGDQSRRAFHSRVCRAVCRDELSLVCFIWLGVLCAFSSFFISIPLARRSSSFLLSLFSFGAVTLTLTSLSNISVLWNYGPSGYPSLLHRGRTTVTTDTVNPTDGVLCSATESFASLYFLIRCIIAYSQSTLFSILRMFHLLRVLRPFRYNNPAVCSFNVSPTDVRSHELSTIEVMYLFFRPSQDAPQVALGFFWSSSPSAPFCTCASFFHYVGLAHHNRVNVFYRARQLTWDDIHQLGGPSSSGTNSAFYGTK